MYFMFTLFVFCYLLHARTDADVVMILVLHYKGFGENRDRQVVWGIAHGRLKANNSGPARPKQ